MKHIDLPTLLQRAKGYFNITPFLIPQAEAEQAIRDGVSFRGTNLLVLIVAIFIASLGLNTNSTAVIIGAMLISPLMGPIIGIGLAVGIHDFDLMKRSFRNLFTATLFSVATSCIYFMISPVNEGHSELLARTSPTIYDVFIGFFGGAAGILAIGSKAKGNVIPGVAIATALMPPLCTVGYGLATLQMHYFIGALYLFFINSVFIALATTVGVRLMNYAYRDFSNPARARRVRNTVYTIALLTMIPAVYLTYSMIVTNTYNNNCSRFVETEFQFPATQVVSYKTADINGQRTLTVTLMGQSLPQDSLLTMMDGKLASYHLNNTRLRIIQGNSIGSEDLKTTSSAMLRDMYSVTQATITSQQRTIDSLQRLTSGTARLDTMSLAISPELKVIFPQVSKIAIAHTVECDIATRGTDTLTVALVEYNATMTVAERHKFEAYLQARLSIPSLRIINAHIP
ncbi:MAG: DUF389 domain-containing protein [Muribaculaceae bacterium]|nr:DUF389 domain-containing protein [Muribaculaceae bacterium]